MKGSVTKLYDINSIIIPKEMLDIHVEEGAIENRLRLLSMRYAKEEQVDTVAEGDIVYCKADAESYADGRTLLIFTGTEMPGAEDAAKRAIGKSVNDQFSAVIYDKTVVLNIEKIIRRILVEVDDDVIRRIGIEGVESVDAYKVYLKKQMLGNMQTEREKDIAQYFMDELCNHSEYTYDEKDMDEFVQSYAEEYASEDIGLELDMDEIKAFAVSQAKQGWVAEAFCRSRNIDIDMKEIENDVDQIIEMETLAGETVSNRSEYIEMYVQNAQLNVLFEYISKIVNENFGG